MSDPFVVIGGDAAGLSAASKCKRDHPDREVIVLEKGRWVSYAHCGMPYYIKGDVDALTDLLSLRPAEIRERGIDLRRDHEVIGIDTDRAVVTVEGPDGRFEQAYGELLIGTGARATTRDLEGVDLDGAFTLHHMDTAGAIRAYLEPPGTIDPATVGDGFADTDGIAAYADREPPDRAAVVGGGYVGIETAEALVGQGCEVHLFQRSGHVLAPFGEAVAEAVHGELREQGVELHLDTPVEGLAGEEDVEAVVTPDGRVPAELAVVGVGIRPNAELVEGTPIERGESGAIRTDRYGRTTVPGVFAAGDCAESFHTVTGDRTWVPLGLTANRAGRAIGRTVAGDPTPTGTIAGTAVVKAFDLECGRTGLLDHDRARAAGFDPVSRTITAGSRSGYYPGAADTTVTLVADRGTGRLLGGAIVGPDRAAIRIDTLVTALDAGLTVGELERQDLAYAPPFSPVWDPILVAAKVLHGAIE